MAGAPNHCPLCLWSRHTSGKKGAACTQPMEPIGIALGEGECTITHRCIACAHVHRHRTAVHDSFEAIAKLSIRQNEVHDESASAQAVIAQAIEVRPGAQCER